MLINMLQPEECRIAILENGQLEELYVERNTQESYVGNIYKGRIVNIEPSIQAAFVDFGVGRNGFLHVSDVDPQYFRDRPPGAPDGIFDLLTLPDLPEESEAELEALEAQMEEDDDAPSDDLEEPYTADEPESTEDYGGTAAEDEGGYRPDYRPPARQREYDDAAGQDDLGDAPPAEYGEEAAPASVPEPGRHYRGNRDDQRGGPRGRRRGGRGRRGRGRREDRADYAPPPAEEYADAGALPPEISFQDEGEAPEVQVHQPEMGEPAEWEPTPQRPRRGRPRRDDRPEYPAMPAAEHRIEEDAEEEVTPGQAEMPGVQVIEPARPDYSSFGASIFGDEPPPPPPAPRSDSRRAPAHREEAAPPPPRVLPAREEPRRGGFGASVFGGGIVDDEPVAPAPADEPTRGEQAEAAWRREEPEPEPAYADDSQPELGPDFAEDEEDNFGNEALPPEEEPAPELAEEDELGPTADYDPEAYRRQPRPERGRGRYRGGRGGDRGGDRRGPRREGDRRGGDRRYPDRDQRGGDRRGPRRGGPRPSDRMGVAQKPPIQDIFRRGQEVLVQVIKEGLGTKGPTLSTYISIPGRYLVVMPGLHRIGVSRKISDDDQRRRLRRILQDLQPPPGLGFIIRTAGLDRTKKELFRDLHYLTRLWRVIVKRLQRVKGPALIYEESDMITRTIRDVFTSEIEAVRVDEPKAFEHAQEFMNFVMPRYADRLVLDADAEPLFHRYGLEREIAKIQQKRVPLPGGGSLVIEQTEALVAIDVNSGNTRVENDAEATALRVNLIAAKEVARQLRLRDLGGVIIIDFIDMRDERHRRQVEDTLREAIRRDRARTKTLRMSQFGIIQMTRQRIRPSLKRSHFQDCPACHGTGQVKTAESMSIEVMRLLDLAAHRSGISRVQIRVAEAVAQHLLNRKRREIAELEARCNEQVTIFGSPLLPPEALEVTCYDGTGAEIILQPPEPAPRRNGGRPPRYDRRPSRESHGYENGNGGYRD